MPEHVLLESYLSERLFGQAPAISEFASAIESAQQGPRRPGRTRAFLLLLGPTGTGKTEMVKLCASWLYGAKGSHRLERFDMGEYQHRDSVLRFLGAPGQPALLGAAIDRLAAQGGGILLLDEIEKAHPDLLPVLLSFDDARSTMADGSTKDLSSCFVIMTSNLGAAEASQMGSSGYSAIRRKVLREAEQVLRKETLARFTASIVMDLLSFEAQECIARSLLAREIAVQSAHWRRSIVVADSRLLGWLVARGFSSDLGARNIRRTIERHLGDALRLAADSARPHNGSRRTALPGDLASDCLMLSVGRDAVLARPFERSASVKALLDKRNSASPPRAEFRRFASCAGVELLDFAAVRAQALDHFLSLDPGRRSWSRECCSRLHIRTSCLWGLVRTRSGDLRVLGESGEGLCAASAGSPDLRVPLYAELIAGGDDEGFFDPQPFCSVALSPQALCRLGVMGCVTLDDFLRPRGPESEQACAQWRALLA